MSSRTLVLLLLLDFRVLIFAYLSCSRWRKEPGRGCPEAGAVFVAPGLRNHGF